MKLPNWATAQLAAPFRDIGLIASFLSTLLELAFYLMMLLRDTLHVSMSTSIAILVLIPYVYY